MHAPPRMTHQDGSDLQRSNTAGQGQQQPAPMPAANNHNFASMQQQPMSGFYAPGQGGWPAPPGTMPSFPSFMMPPFGYPGMSPMSSLPPPGNGSAPFPGGSATMSVAGPPPPFGGLPSFPWPPLGPPGGMPLDFPGTSFPGTQMPPTATNNANNANGNTSNPPSAMSPTPTNTTTNNGGPQSQADEAENSNSSGDNNATTSGSRTNSGGGGSGRNNNGGANHGSRNSFDVSASNSAVIEQRQLIVKFLTDNTSERQFRALFEQHGPVENARIIYDRKTGHTKGFGFITYAHPADTVKALRTMGGYPLHGRQLNVALVQTERRRAFAAHEFSPE